jgi:hypothetical protein
MVQTQRSLLFRRWAFRVVMAQKGPNNPPSFFGVSAWWNPCGFAKNRVLKIEAGGTEKPLE